MANHCGIRFTYAVTGLSSSILTLFIPIAAKSSFVACLVLRIIIGFLQVIELHSVKLAEVENISCQKS